MKLWSRGLGKTEIFMDFRFYKSMKDPDSNNVLVIGRMQDPVNWEFKITLQPEDIGGIMKVAFNWAMISFVIKNLYQYIVYLFHKKMYITDKDLTEKVNAAYEQVMVGRTRPASGRLTA